MASELLQGWWNPSPCGWRTEVPASLLGSQILEVPTSQDHHRDIKYLACWESCFLLGEVLCFSDVCGYTFPTQSHQHSPQSPWPCLHVHCPFCHVR